MRTKTRGTSFLRGCVAAYLGVDSFTFTVTVSAGDARDAASASVQTVVELGSPLQVPFTHVFFTKGVIHLVYFENIKNTTDRIGFCTFEHEFFDGDHHFFRTAFA